MIFTSLFLLILKRNSQNIEAKQGYLLGIAILLLFSLVYSWLVSKNFLWEFRDLYNSSERFFYVFLILSSLGLLIHIIFIFYKVIKSFFQKKGYLIKK